MKCILPTITTTYDSNWREKILEIDKLNLEEVALFPTCLKKEERKEMYEMLSKTKLKRIPFVHLRSDFDEEEISWLKEKYQTKVFNTHSEKLYPLSEKLYPLFNSWDKFKKDFIYLENTHLGFPEDELRDYAGVCVDFSHLENDRLIYPERYEQSVRMMREHKIGCAHLSSIRDEQHLDPEKSEELRYDFHELKNLSEMDYLKKYPQEYFPEFMAIELENSLEEQLRIKEYITKFIKL
ncbi:MAG: hypothetical protein Q7J14_00565 [Candidatus Magasanikbacteria bacterium]|nr:hypothetical protein [Candidatus Magasanikbacteria bacterium]